MAITVLMAIFFVRILPKSSIKMKISKSLLIALAMPTLIVSSFIASSPPTENPAPKEGNFFHDYKGLTEVLSFKGMLLSMDKTPLKNAQVTIGDSTVTTDDNGHFELINHPVDKDFIAITAESEDHRSRFLVLAHKSESETIEIVLKPYDSLNLHWFNEHNHLLD